MEHTTFTLNDVPNDVITLIFNTFLWEYFPVLQFVCKRWYDICEGAADSGIPVPYRPHNITYLACDNYPDLLQWAVRCFRIKYTSELHLKLLGVAAYHGHQESVEALIDPANTNLRFPGQSHVWLRTTRDSFVRTVYDIVVMYASLGGRVDMLKWVKLECGDFNPARAMRFAIEGKKPELVKFILSTTNLHIHETTVLALTYGTPEIVDIVSKNAGQDQNIRRNDAPLMMAIRSKSKKMLEYVLATYIPRDEHKRNSILRSVMFDCAAVDNLYAFRRLLEITRGPWDEEMRARLVRFAIAHNTSGLVLRDMIKAWPDVFANTAELEYLVLSALAPTDSRRFFVLCAHVPKIMDVVDKIMAHYKSTGLACVPNPVVLEWYEKNRVVKI